MTSVCDAPRRHVASKMRVHDYLYDSSFIVSGARDYARTAFKAAMSSAQIVLQPLYRNMFSSTKLYPRLQVAYYPNCRLPEHIDRSYTAYLARVEDTKNQPTPDLCGKDEYKFISAPKPLLSVPLISPDFRPPSPASAHVKTRPRNRATQSVYRESSAQTIPWQPDGKAAEECERTPEVLYLDKLQWGPGNPFRNGDLPADFHTTEIINKLRHARMWTELVEKANFPRWMKKRDAIINDIETNDWIFREAEIDELQEIRLELLHRLQSQQREKQITKTTKKLAKMWVNKKNEMEKKIDHIRRTMDRECRKLAMRHEGGGRAGAVARSRAARGTGIMCVEATDPTSDLHAPLLRHGYQARRRHADIVYDPSLLLAEDHMAAAEPPAWLERCQDLTKTCSGHNLPRDPTKLCERETKWSEQFLENLHNDLKKARLGAAYAAAGPLRVLKPRRTVTVSRAITPEVQSVDDMDESAHQAALALQTVLRGRAVQYLMYEGRTRAAELTEELKTTHGLQKEDKIRIAREESKSREFNARRTEAEQKDDAIAAIVDELCGGAVSAALDFLEKELRRLKEERRQHAFILVALREKAMREAAEAGRRQKEEHRRREHDEMFKHVMGVTQSTVDAYLKHVIAEGVEIAAEEAAVTRAQEHADRIDQALLENNSLSTAEQNELVAELVQQFLLPHTHKTAVRHRIKQEQMSKLHTARDTIFGLIDEAEIKQEFCVRCGRPAGDACTCRVCPIRMEPVETEYRRDPRWKFASRGEHVVEKNTEERFPISHEVRRLLEAVIDDAVRAARVEVGRKRATCHMVHHLVDQHVDISIDAHELTHTLVDIAVGDRTLPLKEQEYRYFMRREIRDAVDKGEEADRPGCPCGLLPSQIREKQIKETLANDPTCYCIEKPKTGIKFADLEKPRDKMLPSELRTWEEMRKCKCDIPTPSSSPRSTPVAAGSEVDPEETEVPLSFIDTTPSSN